MPPKRKTAGAAKTAGAKRAPKKAKKDASPSDASLAQKAVVRADRLTLEQALVGLVEDGVVRYEELEARGLGQAPAPAPKVTATAALTSTGGMGAWERLDVELLMQVVDCCGAGTKFALSEVCKGLCSMRREPRAWRSLDTGTLAGLTAAGLQRLPRSVPTTNLERLTCRSQGYKDPFVAKDWVNFLKQLDCKASLRHLELLSSKFGSGAQALKAAEPFAANLESLKLMGVKQGSMDGVMKFVRAATRLTALDIESSETPWRYFLERLAQLPALQRGPGAKSLLKRIVSIGGWQSTATHVAFVLGLANLFPELRELHLSGLCANDASAAPAPLSKIRVLRLRNVIFTSGMYIAQLYGRGVPDSEEALASYFADVERSMPCLELWETHRKREYISGKEFKAGKRYERTPVLRNIGGLCFSRLNELILEDVGVAEDSFAGVEAPKLKVLNLWLSPLTHKEQRSGWADGSRMDMSDNAGLAAQRAAVVKPLEDSAEGAVKVTWLKPEKKRPATT